ncbi:endospore germination permease [Shouchella sp. 1P09AA]|uniref:GerAB/ArcD/ProY family transporter n=1 Tax=unclassified Shouchella TaxID=2893065 RepID=UPI00399F815D
MESNQSFTAVAYTFIVIYATCSTALLGIPASMAYFVSQDAWLVPIIGSLIGVPIIFCYTMLARWMPNGTIFQMNDYILGKPLGTFASAVFLLFPLFHFPAIISYNVGFMANFLLPGTPLFVLFLLCMLTIVYGIYCGIEPIARTATLISIFFIPPLILLIGLNTPDVDVKMLQPMLRMSVSDGANALAFFMGNVVCNVVIQLTVFPRYLTSKKYGERGLWIGYLIGCTILTVLTFLCITVLSPQVTGRDFYPALSLAQRIELGEFLERIEATITILWFISIYFNLLLYLFAIMEGISHLFKLKDSKALLLPVGMLLLFVSLTMFDSVVQEREFYRFVSIPQSILVGFVFPAFLVFIGAIRRKKNHLPLYPKHQTTSSKSQSTTSST